MIILGLDPGTTTTGFGVIDVVGEKVKPLNYGIIETPPKTPQREKLVAIYTDLHEIFKKYSPECVGIEKLFFNNNPKTAISVAQARGVCVLVSGMYQTKIYEFTPIQIKNSIVGYGRAEKRQVQYMVQNLLSLKEVPKPDDAADALAIALCAFFSAKNQ